MNKQIQGLVKAAPDTARPVTASDALSDTERVDRLIHATLASATAGVSPASMMAAFADWSVHLADSPGKRLELIEKAIRKVQHLLNHQLAGSMTGETTEPCIDPLPQDRRFSHASWQRWPYNFIYQSFLLQQQWWYNATTSVRGVTQQHENVVEFTMRQLLDTVSPSNVPMLNPEVIERTMEEHGANLTRGFQHFLEDSQRMLSGKPSTGSEEFEVGRNLAATPGKVVYQNHLIELIQYAPLTETVHPEPILIVPAWIMKYYILDLSEQNSLVRYLTQQGFTVFMISWRNPTAEDRDLGMDDYRQLGIMAALDSIEQIVPDTAVHAVGYCLGGTLLSITAAAMARNKDLRLKSINLLAAQIDFTEAGELTLFINESQLTFLEDMMWKQGYLDSSQMAGTFQLLRSNDLIWSRLVREYLLGERSTKNDMMAWNADATRMPFRMHSEYLRQLFLNNDLAEGRLMVDGTPVSLGDIRAPIFSVGTERDHVAPWKSVYKIRRYTDTDVTFVLASGGHNGGIVSEPGRAHRHYQVGSTRSDDFQIDADTWISTTPSSEGSWWPEWVTWLQAHSSELAEPPTMGFKGTNNTPLCDAPGTYVLQQ